jgi:glucokinase
VLAGDIGGTKTTIALADVTADRVRFVIERRYESHAHEGLGEIVDAFLRETKEPFDRAGFGIAGPVVDGVCKATNLPWVVDEREIAKRVHVPAHVVNDFVAVALGVNRLEASDLVEINRGERIERAPVAILGAGTGLGEAFLVWNGARYEVIPSEGGHADFAARDERQIGLLRAIIAKHGRASVERVVSGLGLVEIYHYLRDAKVAPESEVVRAALDRGEDLGAVVGQHALEGDDPLCEATIDLFVDAYGAEAGNIALAVLARGGVYVAGGIAPKILAKLTDGRFRAAFVDKGRFRSLLESIPLHVITHPNVGLVGAAVAAELHSPSNERSLRDA